MMLAVPRTSYGAIIGEKGSTLHRLMLECSVLMEVPKPDDLGDVLVHGHMDSCLKAKSMIEVILRDSVQVLSSDKGKMPVMPLPPSYDLATRKAIHTCLFFPEVASQQTSDGLSSLGTLLKYLDSTRVSCDVCVFTITDNRIARRLLEA